MDISIEPNFKLLADAEEDDPPETFPAVLKDKVICNFDNTLCEFIRSCDTDSNIGGINRHWFNVPYFSGSTDYQIVNLAGSDIFTKLFPIMKMCW